MLIKEVIAEDYDGVGALVRLGLLAFIKSDHGCYDCLC